MCKIIRKSFFSLLCAAIICSNFMMLFPPIARATPTTIYVPDNYPTIQAAVNGSNSGDLIVVRDGEYIENLVVNKTVALRSENGADHTTITPASPDPYTDVIEVTADNVEISGFTVSGAHRWGILLDANGCTISQNKIISGIEDFSWAILVQASSNRIIDNEISSGGRNMGIALEHGGSNFVHGNTITNNGNEGIYVVYSSNNLISGNYIANQYNGVCLDGPNHLCNNNTVVQNTIVGNSNAGVRIGGDHNWVYLNDLTSNGASIIFADPNACTCNSPAEATYTYNSSVYTNYLGNCYDNYSGSDANGDGIGDTPYAIYWPGVTPPTSYDYYPLMSSFDNYSLLNLPPNEPTNAIPPNGSVDLSLCPTLESSAFLDPDTGDTQTASLWQLTLSSDNYSNPVFDSGTDITNLTNIVIPSGKLNHSTTYYWRVKYQDNHGAWSGWSAETSFTTIAAPADQAPNQPSNVSPASGATITTLTPTLQSSAFSDTNQGNTHASSQWQITISNDSYSSPVFDTGTDNSNLTSITIPSGKLNSGITYYWHVRYQDNHGKWSDWSAETSFTVGHPPNQPSNIVPPTATTGVSLTLTLQSSPFSDPDSGNLHAASQWQMRVTSGSYSSLIYDSATDNTNLTIMTIPSGLLSHSTTYCWHVRYQDSTGLWSDWSAETFFTTAKGGLPFWIWIVVGAAAVLIVGAIAYLVGKRRRLAQQTAQTTRGVSLTEQPKMVQPIPVAPRQESSSGYTKQEAYNVGKKQKAIMWLILAGIVAYIALFVIPLFGLIVAIVVAITGIILVYQLAAAQKSSVAWLWAFLQIFPLVSWICLLILNQKATRILRGKGVKVGLMGGNSKDLENLLNQ